MKALIGKEWWVNAPRQVPQILQSLSSTARAIGAFVSLPGVAWLAIATDDRCSAARVVLGTVAIGLVLLLIAVERAWGEFDHGNALSYVYVAGLIGTLAAIGALSVWMRRRARTS